ncbi:alpha/beta fold hydrolase [Bradyrhizobium sp. HKCCYLS20291]|uniref:alpha/beta fold hydrolase n=1 Tax=Bradyrhizobium sp. HKCCYLS20291 TaxID=3420766 RepID=UPI003EC00F09
MPIETAESYDPQPQQHSIAGIQVSIEGDGPRTVVMIHGWPDTAALWDSQVAALRAHARCVRFTLPGFDRSHPRRIYSLEEIVATIGRIVDLVSRDRPVTLLLHDWGCVFGYRFAEAYSQRVEAIVGVDVGDAGSREHLQSLDWRAKLGTAAYQLWLALAWHMPVRLGDVMTRSMARLAGAPAEVALIGAHMNYPYHVQWTRGYGRAALAPRWPMLFIYGTRKPFMFHSESWARAVQATPHGRALPLETGHWVMHQAPEEFNRELLSWLDMLPAT